MLKRLLFTLVSTVFIYVSVTTNTVVNAAVLFEDNFDDPNLSATLWQNSGPQLYNAYGIPTNWLFTNGEYGIVISLGPAQFNEAVPVNWNNDWKDYIFEADFRLVNGSDFNLVFRYTDHNNWYGIHGNWPSGPDAFWLQKAGEGWYQTPPRATYIYQRNKRYRFKAVVNGSNIKFYIKDKDSDVETQLWDWNDPGSSITQGKPGLQVSTGVGDPNLEIWFDNVVVRTIEEDELGETPTILIPGLGASMNFKELFLNTSNPNGWALTPGSNIYDNILTAYEDDPNFYVFYYDWRQPVLSSAQDLYQFILGTVKPANKVNLIGHSLGGLVGRACLQKLPRDCYINRLITIGSPHAGAIDAYPLLEAGEIWRSGVTRVALETLIHFNQRPGETRREAIARIAPVLTDLLPTFDYLRLNGQVVPSDRLSLINTLLPSLSDITLLEGKTDTLYGTTFSTVRYLNLTPRDWLDGLLGDWPDGKVIGKDHTSEGDEAVLVLSATLNSPTIPRHRYEYNHGNLISKTEPLEKIFSLLGGTIPNKPYGGGPEAVNYLVFLVHSPVSISSPDRGGGDYQSENLVIIANPQNRDYRLNVKGLKNGYYQLSVGLFYDQEVYWHDYFRQAKAEVTDNLDFSLNSLNPAASPLIGNLSQISSQQLQNRIDEFRLEVVELTTSQYNKSKLYLSLSKIEVFKTQPEQAVKAIAALRSDIAELQNRRQMDKPTADLFRQKGNSLTAYLLSYAQANPLSATRSKAQATLALAKYYRDLILRSRNRITANAALVYLEAESRLQAAQDSLNSNNYYQSFLLSQVAGNLYQEAKAIR